MHKLTRCCATALALVAFTAPAFAQSKAPAGDATQPQTQIDKSQATGAAPTDSKVDPAQPGAAASTDTTAPAGSTFLTEQSPDELTSDDLVGMNVVNGAGEEIGEIEDLVFDDSNSNIVAAIVSVGGFLGIGSKNVGVAWGSFDVQKRDGKTVAQLDMTKEQLEKAPEFKPFKPAPPPAATGTGGATGTLPPPTQPRTN